MTKPTYKHSDDLRSAGKLTTDGVHGLIDIIEGVHVAILRLGGLTGDVNKPARGLSGFIYRIIRFFTRISGHGIDQALSRFHHLLGEKASTPQRELLIAVLNGVLGNYLEQSHNSFAIPMAFRQHGHPIKPQNLEQGNKPLLLMMHGLCMNDLQWERKEHNHGELLAEEFDFTPIYLHYNTGRHISQNGEEFDRLMEELSQTHPNREIILLTHSMGGLVARSALHYAEEQKHTWPQNVNALFFLGTPHHGAPMEKTGNWIDTLLDSNPYSAPFARLGKIRSAGITDMRYGNLLPSDWQQSDRFDHRHRPAAHLPLPQNIPCYTIAASKTNDPNLLKDHTLGDGLVTLQSALGEHRIPEKRLHFPDSHSHIVRGISHLDLLNNQDVYGTLRTWVGDLQ